jgi:hypothetical protein
MKRVTTISFSLLILGALGCGKGSKDTGPVLASVGGEKITAGEFKELVDRIAPDAEAAKRLLEDADPTMRAQRNKLLGQLVDATAVIHMAKEQNLDADPRVKAAVKLALANAYRTALLANRMPASVEPAEADLKTLYDGYAVKAKAAGQAMPPFDQVKPQLAESWRREQQERVMGQLDEEITKKVPTTYAEGYAPVAIKGF